MTGFFAKKLERLKTGIVNPTITTTEKEFDYLDAYNRDFRPRINRYERYRTAATGIGVVNHFDTDRRIK